MLSTVVLESHAGKWVAKLVGVNSQRHGGVVGLMTKYWLVPNEEQ